MCLRDLLDLMEASEGEKKVPVDENCCYTIFLALRSR